MDIHCHVYRSLIRAAQSCQLYEYAVKGYSRAAVNVWLRGVLQYSLQGKERKRKIIHQPGIKPKTYTLSLSFSQYIRKGRENGRCWDEYLVTETPR